MTVLLFFSFRKVVVAMGISPALLNAFRTWKDEGLFDCVRNVLELGSQEIFCWKNPDSINLTLEHFDAPPLSEPEARHLAERGPAADFYRRLGFGYAAIDTSGAFGAIALDLNYESLPGLHHNHYEFVTNFGTSEHVANQLNCFEIMHDATCPGGYMVHELICTGEMNHGLVNYNPKMFWMLSKWNFYDYVGMWMNSPLEPESLPQNVRDITHVPELVEKNFRSHALTFHVVMRKQFNAPFVPPLDGDISGATPAQRRRYWSHADGSVYDRIQHLQYRDDDRAREEILRLIDSFG